MTNLLGSTLGGVAGLARRMAARSGPRTLSGNVQAYVMKEFRLLPSETANLRCVARSSGFVRVFDAAKAREQGVTVKGYKDLDRYPELVLCYGNANKRGAVHLKREHRTATGELKAS